MSNHSEKSIVELLRELLTEVKAKLSKLPRHILIPASAFVALLIVVGIVAMFHHHATPASAANPNATAIFQRPAARPKRPVAASAEPKPTATPPPTSAAPEATHAASVPATATSAANAMQVVLAGERVPKGEVPTAGRVVYTLDAAAPVGGEFSDKHGPWISIGKATRHAQTSSFGALPDHSLAASLPSRGAVKETWQFWTQIRHAGDHLLVLKLSSSAYGAASVSVDGQSPPVASLGRHWRGTRTAIGTADLGKGWHSLRVTLEQPISPSMQPGDDSVSVFLRGPDAPAPVSLTPSVFEAAKGASSAAALPHSGEPTKKSPEGKAVRAQPNAAGPAPNDHEKRKGHEAGGGKK